MRKPKRQPADSATAAVDAMLKAALAPLPLPAHVKLRKGDQPFWAGLAKARARDEWTDADLVLGAQLARVQADIEAESKALDAEATVITNKRGTLLANPRVGVLDQLVRRELAMLRALRMGGPTPIRDLNERRGIERAAGRARAEIEDDLLA